MQAKALYQKLQRDAESLKGLWVAKLNLRGRAELASPGELRAYEVIRDKVNHNKAYRIAGNFRCYNFSSCEAPS